MIGGEEVAYAPKSSTNLVSITRVQRAGLEDRYLAESNRIVSFVNVHKQLVAHSESTCISELTGMNPICYRNSNIAFFNAGSNDATRLAHRRVDVLQ